MRAEIGQILHTDTHPHTHTTAAKLVVRMDNFMCIFIVNCEAGRKKCCIVNNLVFNRSLPQLSAFVFAADSPNDLNYDVPCKHILRNSKSSVALRICETNYCTLEKSRGKGKIVKFGPESTIKNTFET